MQFSTTGCCDNHSSGSRVTVREGKNITNLADSRLACTVLLEIVDAIVPHRENGGAGLVVQKVGVARVPDAD